MKHRIDTDAQKNAPSTRRHWDAIYSSISRKYHLYHYQEQLVETVLRNLPDTQPLTTLEVGCGKGNELLQLARSGIPCLGLDFSETALSLLRKRRDDQHLPVALIRGDALAIPIQDSVIRLVYSQGVMEHFREPDPALQEQRRILSPGGILIMEVPNKWNLYTIYKHILMMLHRWPPGWETEYSPHDLRTIFTRNGFEVLEMVGWDVLPMKIYRKLKKKLGFSQGLQPSLLRNLRHRIEHNTVLLWFFESVTVVARIPTVDVVKDNEDS